MMVFLQPKPRKQAHYIGLWQFHDGGDSSTAFLDDCADNLGFFNFHCLARSQFNSIIMAFNLQQQNIENQQQVLQSQGQYVGPPLDSITLGQLRQMVNAPQKPKVGQKAK
jgi:hypothetical protein